MLLKLALRNVARNMRRLRPMLIALMVAFAVLLFGNALIEQTDRAFSRAYVDHVSGVATVSERSADSFTLFGTDSLLVGEYLVPPTLADPAEVSSLLDTESQILDTTFVVTGAARLEVGNRRTNHFLFGVDFADYRAFFPDLKMIAGSFPEDQQPGILLQADSFRELFGDAAFADLLGESVVLTSAISDSFVIRDAPLLGVYDYPVDDALLSQVAILDADTVRSLNGYVTGGIGATVPREQEELITGSLDDLFGAPAAAQEAEPSPDSGSPSVLDELDLLGAVPRERDAETRSTAWNYALLRGDDQVSARTIVSRAQDALSATPNYLVRDWRRSVGGNVMIVFAIRLAANVGMIFVILGAAITTVNAIVLSVLDRTKEIGTMRAIGATRATVARLLTAETIFAVFGSAAVGVLLGAVGIAITNTMGLTVSNQYLRILFGGAGVRGLVTGGLLSLHFLGAFGVALLSVIYPLRKALRLSPMQAINA